MALQQNSMPAVKPKLFYGWIIVTAACLVILTMYGTLATFGIFFESMLAEFGWSRAAVAAALSLVIVVRASLYMITGRLTDRYGPRAVVTTCGLLLGLGYVLMSRISAVWHFYLLYILVGVGMSSAWIPQVSTVARWFEKRRGLAISLAGAGEGLGIVLMVPAANWFISVYDWRSSYLAVGIFGAIVITTAAQFLKRDPKKMGLLPYGAGEVAESPAAPPVRGLTLREAAGTGELWLLCAVYLSFLFGLDTVMAHIVVYAVGLGTSPAGAASILATIGGVAVIGRLAMGLFADRAGSKLAIILCLALSTLAWLWLQQANAGWMLYPFAVVFGFVFGGILVQFPLIIAQRFGLTAHGAIMGVVSFVAMTLGASGPVLVGRLFDISGSYRVGFLICGAASALGLILALFSRPVQRAK
ncbi:MAG: MFS transporter [Chloroflexota bacterium]|nr:MFS transporter [Chloroflexota bacterium]